MSVMLVLHIVFLLIWSAALLYFPRLFIRGAGDDPDEKHRAVHMQHSLYALVMTPSALLAVLAGIWLVFERGMHGGWLQVKLGLVFLMVLFHIYCGETMAGFKLAHGPRQLWIYRVLPLIPALLITAVFTLVAAKPF